MLVYRKGIFCLEAEWFGLRSSVSVRPGLEFLRASDYHVPFIHRDVATRPELEHYLRKWFQERQSGFEILWVAIHSRKGLLLPGDMRRPDERVHLDRLEEVLAGKCGGRFIHFGGCSTIDVPSRRIGRFMRATGAVGVSGFCKEVDWTESTLFEMSFLLELQKHPLTASGLRAAMRALRASRAHEIRESAFRLHVHP